MSDIISDRKHTARKRHTCNSCMGSIEPGKTYWRTLVKDGPRAVSFCEHLACRRASEIVAAHLPFDVIADGMPRVCEMEPEEIETVVAEDGETALAVWPGRAYGYLSEKEDNQ